MSCPIIKAELNCSRISKARLFRKQDKQGNDLPGQYLKIVLIPKKDKDQFGNDCYMIKEDVSQDERSRGIEGAFIGNGKVLVPKPKTAPGQAAAPAANGAAPAATRKRSWRS